MVTSSSRPSWGSAGPPRLALLRRHPGTLLHRLAIVTAVDCVPALLARNDLVIFTVLGNARRGVTRIVLATTGRPPYASARTVPATVTYRTSSTTLSSVAPYCASTFLAFA